MKDFVWTCGGCDRGGPWAAGWRPCDGALDRDGRPLVACSDACEETALAKLREERFRAARGGKAVPQAEAARAGSAP
jgi:hypothetical protein